MNQLSLPTRFCKICFKEIKDNSFYAFSHKDNIICESCFSTLKAKFINFKIGSIDALSIYDYNEAIKKLIYTFKGCYDYELKDVFLTRYLSYLKLLYKGYIVVPVPSSEIDNQKRGFNHVKEVFKNLGLPMVDVLKKVNKEKQSSKTSKDRLKVNKNIESCNIEQVKDKKVLIVDDIYTTGATMFRSIELVKKGKPKVIKVLVLAKTIDLNKRK